MTQGARETLRYRSRASVDDTEVKTTIAHQLAGGVVGVPDSVICQ
jgi:hypothetical protein